MNSALKKGFFYTLLILLYLMIVIFPSIDIYGKKYILCVSITAVSLIIFCFYDWQWLKKQFINGFTSAETQPLRLYSEVLSRISWFAFLLAVLALNFEWILVARALIAIFLMLVICCAILTYFDLKQNDSLRSRTLQFLFGMATPIVYIISTSYVASYFLKSSGLKIDESPLIQLWLGWAFFAVCMLFVIQLFSIALFFFLMKDLSTGYFLNVSAIMIGGTFLILIATGWFNNFQVIILDYATNKEWGRTFNCGNKEYTYGYERYFQVEDDKYISYFSDRFGHWGFAKIRCGKNREDITRVETSSIKMPKWFVVN